MIRKKYSHAIENAKRADRSVQSARRKHDRDLRGPEMQLQELDNRLGVGVGAKKERDRLEGTKK
jgi:hypothetical protein